MIDYSPFWNTLEKSSENWYTLTNKYHMSHSTLHRLKHNKMYLQKHLTICVGFLIVIFAILSDTFHLIQTNHYNKLQSNKCTFIIFLYQTSTHSQNHLLNYLFLKSLVLYILKNHQDIVLCFCIKYLHMFESHNH